LKLKNFYGEKEGYACAKSWRMPKIRRYRPTAQRNNFGNTRIKRPKMIANAAEIATETNTMMIRGC
jgi:hypothetical protein